MNLLIEILSTLKKNRLRTVLTGFSVAWGIYILIILLGAGNGLMNGVMSNFGERANNLVRLRTHTTSKPYKGLKSGRHLTFKEEERSYLAQHIKTDSEPIGIMEIYSEISSGSESTQVNILGVPPNYIKHRKLEFTQNGGRFINDLDLKQLNKVIVLDKYIAEKLFRNKSAINQIVTIEGIAFKVIGINNRKPRWGRGKSYIPHTTFKKIFNSQEIPEIEFLANDLKNEKENEAFNQRVTTLMAQKMQFDPTDRYALHINNSQEDYIQTMKIFNGIKTFIIIIGMLTLIAGVVSISNIMLVTVKERTREIGIRKAIGAPPATIIRAIIVETVLITSFFGYIGMLAGVATTELVNYILIQTAAQGAGEAKMTIFKDPTVQLDYILFSTIVLIVAGVIAGYLPAKRAVKIKPIEAMREE